jgi:hypothetical protein
VPSSWSSSLQTPRWLSDIQRVTPHFGRITQVLAAVFAISGIGAAGAMLSAGHYSGSGSDKVALLGVATVCLTLAAGLFLEYSWAWWAGTVLAGSVVVLDLSLRADRGWIVWAFVLGAFLFTGLHETRGPDAGDWQHSTKA